MSTESYKPKTILVIDDELDMLQLLNRILTQDGYRVLAAADGNYGLNLVKDSNPDLVLLDMMMPGPDGIMTLESIRKISNVPVIMVTAKRDTESLRESLDLGADDYIKKPFSPTELLSRVHAKLRRC